MNEEFRSLITALGTGIGEDFKLSALKYHRIIILADADQDGAHIRAILLTFFYRYMKPLITGGHIFRCGCICSAFAGTTSGVCG